MAPKKQRSLSTWGPKYPTGPPVGARCVQCNATLAPKKERRGEKYDTRIHWRWTPYDKNPEKPSGFWTCNRECYEQSEHFIKFAAVIQRAMETQVSDEEKEVIGQCVWCGIDCYKGLTATYHLGGETGDVHMCSPGCMYVYNEENGDVLIEPIKRRIEEINSALAEAKKDKEEEEPEVEDGKQEEDGKEEEAE